MTVDRRILADRQQEAMDELDRPQFRKGGTPTFAGQVYNGGAMGSTTPLWYLTHPADFSGDECESCPRMPVVDTQKSIPVIVLGKAPSVGDFLIAEMVGGKWVAEEGAKPKPVCTWLCGSTIGIINPTGCFGTGRDALASLTLGPGGVIASVKILDGGTCYTVAHPTVSINGGGTGAHATATVGEVTSITMTSLGSKYDPANPPAVTIAPPGIAGGSAATATATVDPATKEISGITITSGGSLYQVANPAVTIGPPGAGGTQATATATAKPGVVTSLTLTAGGSGYIDNSVPDVLNVTLSCSIWSFTWPIFIQAIGDPSPDGSNSTCRYFGSIVVDFPATAFTAATKGVTLSATMSFGSIGGTRRWGIGVEVGVKADTSQSHNCPGCQTIGPPKIDGTVYGLVRSTNSHIGNPDGSISSGVTACTSRPYSTSVVYHVFPAGCVTPDGSDWYILSGGTCPTDGHTPQPSVPVTLTVSEP